MDEIARQIALLAREWPPALMRQIAEILEGGKGFEAASRALPNPQTQRSWKTLVTLAGAGQIPASALALSFHLALQNDQQNEKRVPELVWTGPTLLSNATWRRTDAAFLETIQSAQHTLWLVTFAVYGGTILRAALHQAAARGVEIHLVCEWKGAGKVQGNEKQLLSVLPPQTRLYEWPIENRTRNTGRQFGSLHAKIAVADENLALLSSANLTDCALDGNIESGVLLRGEAARQIAAQLRGLVENGIWRRLPFPNSENSS